MIRFTFSPMKAVGAVAWMLSKSNRLDLHTILKAAYFADKEALNKHGRPVFGATYRAMNYGPVPLEIYEMLKGEPLWLPEIGRDDYPWEREGHYVTRRTDEQISLDHLNEIDQAAVCVGFQRSGELTFNERTQATHGPDWTKAYPGIMAYEDMIETNRPDRELLIRELERLGPHLVL